MSYHFIIEPIMLFIAAVILLRFSGRRSIAQMTIAQTVVIISMGGMITEPYANKSIFETVLVAAVYVLMLLVFELFEYKTKGFNFLFVGESIVIIENGVLKRDVLKKLKLTEDELYSRIVQKGIVKLSDIERATIEYNGELGYQLKKGARAITVDDMDYILNYVISSGITEKVELSKELSKLPPKQKKTME